MVVVLEIVSSWEILEALKNNYIQLVRLVGIYAAFHYLAGLDYSIWSTRVAIEAA